ncbi:MAG: hypothetical protein ACI4AL_04160 [Aristaeellaceae bacterium]
MDIKTCTITIMRKNDAPRSILPMAARRFSWIRPIFPARFPKNENFCLTESKNRDNIAVNKFIFLKDDDEDGWNRCFQRAGGCCEPATGVPQTYHFRVEGLKHQWRVGASVIAA